MLEWNVFVGDFNARRIRQHNIFNHYSFYEDCLKNKRKNGKDREAFFKQLKTDLMYYYWSKCEWEVIVSHWPPREDFRDEKIDVYDQVVQNWEPFTDYVWNHLSELKKRKE